jgi:hypothetical protein
MDFTIRTTGAPEGSLTLEKDNTCLTDIFCTLNIQKGTWFWNPSFGIDWLSFPKITASVLDSLNRAIVDGLQWMIQAGRISAISCMSELDTNIGQVNIKVEVTQADGISITYQQYRPLGLGPTSDYSIVNGSVV